MKIQHNPMMIKPLNNNSPVLLNGEIKRLDRGAIKFDKVERMSSCCRAKADKSACNKEVKDIQNSITTIQSADTALDKIKNMLEEARELAGRAYSTDTNPIERLDIQKNYEDIKNKLHELIKDTDFKDIKIPEGFFDEEEINSEPLSLVMQIGAVSGETLTVNLENLDLTNGGNNINMSTRTTAENAVSAVQSLINRVSEEKEGLGAWQSKLQSALLGIVKNAKEENGLTVGYRHPEIVMDNLAKFRDKLAANTEYAAYIHTEQNPQSVLDLLM